MTLQMGQRRVSIPSNARPDAGFRPVRGVVRICDCALTDVPSVEHLRYLDLHNILNDCLQHRSGG